MAYTEILPSGKYRGIYLLRDGSRRSAGTFPHKRAAQKAADAAEVEARSLKWRDPRAGLRTWGEWHEEWWASRAVEPGTLSRDRSAINKHMMPKWGDVPLADITRFAVKAWAAELAKSGLAVSTVRRHIYVFSASLAAAMDAEVIDYNPAFKIDVVGGHEELRRYLKGVELQRLLAQFDGVHLAMMTTQVGTGLRWGELAGLQIHRVDLERDVVRVAEVWDDVGHRLKPYPKGKRPREVPIPEWVKPLLTEQVAARTEGFVFLAPAGGVVSYQNFRNRVWVPAAEAAQVAGAKNHDLRHTYASMLIQNGVPLAVVGQLLGHRSAQTTARYADLEGLPSDPILSGYAKGVIDRLAIARGEFVGNWPPASASYSL